MIETNQSDFMYYLCGTYPARTVLTAPSAVNVAGCASLYADKAVNVAARRIWSKNKVLLTKLVER